MGAHRTDPTRIQQGHISRAHRKTYRSMDSTVTFRILYEIGQQYEPTGIIITPELLTIPYWDPSKGLGRNAFPIQSICIPQMELILPCIPRKQGLYREPEFWSSFRVRSRIRSKRVQVANHDKVGIYPKRQLRFLIWKP